MQRAPRLGDVLHQEHNSLGLMRLAMATAVLVSHCFYLASGTALAEPLIGWTGYTLGQHGVQVFFIMSGVLVMQSLMMSGSVRDYAIARALRIFPALAVCILITALIVGPALTRLPLATYLNSPETPGYIVKTIMLVTGMAPLPGLFADNPVPGLVNSSLWTLKYEVICYILLAAFSAIALASGRHRAVFIAALAVAVPLIFYKRPECPLFRAVLRHGRRGLHRAEQTRFDRFRRPLRPRRRRHVDRHTHRRTRHGGRSRLHGAMACDIPVRLATRVHE
jgi:peptidoglycan/LPS O-acetylase OafA/YrhL